MLALLKRNAFFGVIKHKDFPVDLMSKSKILETVRVAKSLFLSL